MKWGLSLVVVASCSKTGPAPDRAKPSADVFAGTHGAVVTADDVKVDGKSLGILPSRLATDRDAFKAAIGESLVKNNKSALALAYTDDAPADAVLGALRGIEERVAPPPPPPPPAEDGSDTADESGGTGTAMALDEGKMGGGQYKMARANEAGDSASVIGVTAIVGGKPAEICRVVASPASDPNDTNDERVRLTLQIGHAQLVRFVSRVNDRAPLHALDLDHDLHTQKASAFFSDRDDIELAAAPDAKGADVTPVLASSCKAGFREVQPLSLDELTEQLAQK